VCLLTFLLLLLTGYQVEWQLPIQRGFVSVGPDVTGDSLPELVIEYGYTHRDSLVFVSGRTRQRVWTIPNPYSNYDYWQIVGTANTDGDGADELLVYGYRYEYTNYRYYTRFHIYDCNQRTLEFVSPEFVSNYHFPYPRLAEIDGDGIWEICIGYGDTINYTFLVYGWQGAGINQYGVKSRTTFNALPVPAVQKVTIPTAGGKNVFVFDPAGRLIRTIPVPANSGSVIWDGLDEKKEPVQPGVYFYHNGNGTGKIELVR